MQDERSQVDRLKPFDHDILYQFVLCYLLFMSVGLTCMESSEDFKGSRKPLYESFIVVCVVQKQNRVRALEYLRARVYDLQRTKMLQSRNDLRTAAQGTGDRSDKIRTYNFPQVSDGCDSACVIICFASPRRHSYKLCMSTLRQILCWGSQCIYRIGLAIIG